MDGELERYHKTNSGLDLLISNLKLKQTGLTGGGWAGQRAWSLEARAARKQQGAITSGESQVGSKGRAACMGP